MRAGYTPRHLGTSADALRDASLRRSSNSTSPRTSPMGGMIRPLTRLGYGVDSGAHREADGRVHTARPASRLEARSVALVPRG